jgi:hypothetical protein
MMLGQNARVLGSLSDQFGRLGDMFLRAAARKSDPPHIIISSLLPKIPKNVLNRG